MAPALEIVPANQATWEDLQAVFGTSGDPARCWCQRYKMAPGESWASVGAEQLAFRLRQQTDCGHPESDTTTGLVAYLGGEPVGWCASMYVEPLTTAYADTGRIVAWCDRNATRMAVYDEVVTAAGGRPPARYAPDDFNRLLEEERPDVVVVTSPDHTHAAYTAPAGGPSSRSSSAATSCRPARPASSAGRPSRRAPRRRRTCGPPARACSCSSHWEMARAVETREDAGAHRDGDAKLLEDLFRPAAAPDPLGRRAGFEDGLSSLAVGNESLRAERMVRIDELDLLPG